MEGAVRLSGLWRNEGKRGSYLSGTLGGGRLYVMKNERKTGEKDPDFLIYLKPQTPKTTGPDAKTKAAGDDGGDFLD